MILSSQHFLTGCKFNASFCFLSENAAHMVDDNPTNFWFNFLESKRELERC